MAGTPVTVSADTVPAGEEVLRLLPGAGARLAPGEVYADLTFPPVGQRPYVLINMVSSLDGRATVGRKAGGIGSTTDRLVMGSLRAAADAVMTGAGTLRAERIALSVPEDLSRKRASRGMSPQPLAVVATTSGDLPLRDNLPGTAPDNLLVMASVETPRSRLPELSSRATVEVAPSLTEALWRLKQKYSVGALLVEGGPSLNHALIRAGLVDEMFLTLAPKLLGGRPPDAVTILEGCGLASRDMSYELISVHAHGSELFLRYALHAAEGGGIRGF